jgi:hippurate hydrolase
MDALPITEATGLPHASTRPGVMHACGHDGHTAALLGAARLLAADSTWSGTVHLVFQPAEEGLGGAKAMLADGLFQRFPMDAIFGWHNWPGIQAGTLVVHDGPVMAGGARVEIVLRGQAGHAAMPHQTRDPIVAGAHLLVALQSIVARNIDPLQPAVLTIGTLQAGEALNQVADRAVLRGTARAHSDAVMEQMEQAIARIAAGIAQTFGMTQEVLFRRGAAVTRNHKAEADLAAASGMEAGMPVRRDLPPSMAGEDFGFYLQERPGAFAWIGNGVESAALHNPRYDFNDAILPVASRWLAATARRALAG